MASSRRRRGRRDGPEQRGPKDAAGPRFSRSPSPLPFPLSSFFCSLSPSIPLRFSQDERNVFQSVIVGQNKSPLV